MARPNICDDPSYRREGGGSGRALRKRLETGRLTTADEEMVRRVRVIRVRRREGKSWPPIAQELGIAEWRKVAKFAAGGMFTCVDAWLVRQEEGGGHAVAASVKDVAVPTPKENRGFLTRLVPKALRRLEAALDQGMSGPVLVESKAADHAMDTVLEAAGLTEPEGAGRPTIHIDTLVIQSLTQQIRADDARVVTIEAEAS